MTRFDLFTFQNLTAIFESKTEITKTKDLAK